MLKLIIVIYTVPNMDETEPLYFTKFREHIDHKLETHVPKYFKDFQMHIDQKFETHVPKYFRDFQMHIDQRFETYIPKYFRDFQVHIDKKIESEINSLAVMIKDNFATKDDLEEMKKDMVTKEDIKDMVTTYDIKDMATKEDVREAVAPILKHIGSYEMRAKNIEDILLKDHKPRIVDLEKKVFA